MGARHCVNGMQKIVKRYQDDPLNYHGGILIGTGHAVLEVRFDLISANSHTEADDGSY